MKSKRKAKEIKYCKIFLDGIFRIHQDDQEGRFRTFSVSLMNDDVKMLCNAM